MPRRKLLDPNSFHQPLILDMGAGESINDGVTRVDPFVDSDINAYMWDVPLPDGCVEEIYSLNSLEHVEKAAVLPTIREWHRLLKVGGKVRVLVPDLEWACKFWLKYPTTEWPMDIIYGNQNHGGEFHMTGFTPAILQGYFEDEENAGKWEIEEIQYWGGEEIEAPLDNGRKHVKVKQRGIGLVAKKV